MKCALKQLVAEELTFLYYHKECLKAVASNNYKRCDKEKKDDPAVARNFEFLNEARNQLRNISKRIKTLEGIQKFIKAVPDEIIEMYRKPTSKKNKKIAALEAKG